MLGKLGVRKKKKEEPEVVELEEEEVRELRRKTKFTAEEIQKSYRRFMGENPNGKMTLKGLKKIYDHLFPDGDATKFAEYVFKTYDSNEDGFVDFQEFITGLSLTRRGTLRQKLTWIFSVYDADSNGYISKEEMLAVLTSISKMSRDLPEFEKISPEEKVEQIFEQMDRNKDGHLSLNEFIEGVRRNPHFEVLLNNTGQVNSDIHKF